MSGRRPAEAADGAAQAGDRAALAELVPALARARVLCLGDLMLDRFVEGEVARISPEAPVPVLRVQRRRAMLGGAGTVARNVAALGSRVVLVGLVGTDAAAEEVRALCADDPGIEARLVDDASRPTAIKTRYLAGGQQLLRTDEERAAPADAALESALVEAARAALAAGVDAVALSDYGKGALTGGVIAGVIEAAHAAGVPVVVDPKGRDYTRYRGADLVTPNRVELADAAGMPTGTEEEITAAATSVISTAGLARLLTTRGAEGMVYVDPDRAVAEGTRALEVFDVSGAGDTVVAAVAAALGAGIDYDQAWRLANIAAGVVVAKVGTAVARADEVTAALLHADIARAEDKLLSRAALAERVAAWRRRGLAVGFTNGCFDLLHPGHVHLVRQARAACDRLVVALNTDASTRRLKGPDRPVQSEAARAAVLGSLADVDAVVLFDEDTPEALIEALLPDVLVKGADYARDQVVGAAIVERHGGRVVLAELLDGHSTTETIARMERSGAK